MHHLPNIPCTKATLSYMYSQNCIKMHQSDSPYLSKNYNRVFATASLLFGGCDVATRRVIPTAGILSWHTPMRASVLIEWLRSIVANRLNRWVLKVYNVCYIAILPKVRARAYIFYNTEFRFSFKDLVRMNSECGIPEEVIR